MCSFLNSLKYRLEYAFFRLIAGTLGALPIEIASRVSGAIWRFFAPFSSRHNRALAAIELALPDLSAGERDRVARDMWENLGRVFAESFHLSDLLQSDRVELEEGQELKDLAEHGKNCVFGCPHLGNWEVAAIVPHQLNLDFCGVYQRIKNPFVDEFVRKSREPLYPAGLFAKQDGAAKKILSAVKSGASAGTMADLRDSSGVSIEFFGNPAPTNVFPALLARTFDIPLYASVVVRVPKNKESVRFKGRVVRVDVPRTADRRADILAGTIALHQQFEAFIRENPEQWMWAHRRWG